MDTFSNNNDDNKFISPSKILGAMGWFDEANFEKGAETVTQVATGFLEAIVDLKEDVVGKKEKLPSNGSIEFNKKAAQDKNRKEVDRKKLFFHVLKEDQNRVQRASDKMLLEDEINDIVTNLPTEQKNRLLHYQASYKDRSIYQRAELRKKLIEDAKKAEEKKKQAAIPSPAKQANAMDTAFEGGSGKSGSGSANFSSTGGGAG